MQHFSSHSDSENCIDSVDQVNIQKNDPANYEGEWKVCTRLLSIDLTVTPQFA